MPCDTLWRCVGLNLLENGQRGRQITMHSRIGDGNDESDDGDSDGVGDDGDDKDGQRSRQIALHIGIVIKYWAADIVYTSLQ